MKQRPDPEPRQRVAALIALALLLLAIVLLIDHARAHFPWGLVAFGAMALALTLMWQGLLREGRARAINFLFAVVTLVVAGLALLEFGGDLAEVLLIAAALILSIFTAGRAFRIRTPLPDAPAPKKPVLFFNPKSGGGKAERFSVASEARSRGIEPIELELGTDLTELVRDAVADGADGLAMAGGDGSQAVVAAVAAELDLPYACIPAGTRNHFALDLGVDRDDVVGALDAFVDGGERRVDLAEVNGRVFVNNVSLGLYAEAVQREGYRDAKIQTIFETVPEVLGPDGQGLDMRWRGPGGNEHSEGAAVLVSNNRYRLGQAVGSGTRPRIDDGVLGVTVVSAATGRGSGGRLPQRPWREWSTPVFEVHSDRTVPAGIDGEAVKLEPPLEFRIRPAVLRVRIARAHPGASPSAEIPEGMVDGVRALFRIAAGKNPLGERPDAEMVEADEPA